MECILELKQNKGNKSEVKRNGKIDKNDKSENLNKTKRNRSGMCGACLDQIRTLIEHTLMLQQSLDEERTSVERKSHFVRYNNKTELGTSWSSVVQSDSYQKH